MANLDVPQDLFEQAKSYLLRADDNGDSLYDHLCNLLTKVLEENPKDSLSKFEDLSHQLRTEEFRTEKGVYVKWRPNEVDPRKIKRSQETASLFQKSKSAGDVSVQDLVEQASHLELAGIGLPKEEVFQIMLSIASLATEKKLKEPRFWGKLLGTTGNYIVVEARQEWKEPTPEELKTFPRPAPGKKLSVSELPAERPGVGVNTYKYYVCSYAGGPWTELPDVTPLQLHVARQIKKYLTGNLDAQIVSFPAFPGEEREYLRAQIARISSGTILCPTGFFSKKDIEDAKEGQPPEYEQSGDFEEKDAIQFQELENISHLLPEILPRSCRVTKYVPPPIETEDGEEPEEEAAEDEEEESEALKPLKGDADEPDLPTMQIKKPTPPPAADADGEAEPEETEDETIPKNASIPAYTRRLAFNVVQQYSVAVVRSNRWPGATFWTAEKGRKFGNIYIGFGHKYTGVNGFAPILATAIQKEDEDVVQAADIDAKAEQALLKGEEPAPENPEDEEEEAEAEDE